MHIHRTITYIVIKTEHCLIKILGHLHLSTAMVVTNISDLLKIKHFIHDKDIKNALQAYKRIKNIKYQSYKTLKFIFK